MSVSEQGRLTRVDGEQALPGCRSINSPRIAPKRRF